MERHTAQDPGCRVRFRVAGTVQGVGYRPFVYRLATGLGLSGFVRNTPAGVEIEVEGGKAAIGAFARGLNDGRPPAARIVDLSRADIEPRGDGAFVIESSGEGGGRELVIPPDIATCDDCLAELLDPADRRHGYPFINCTNCGPRYTIVRSIPYDRPGTTMAPFTMCPACRAEYGDPLDRRFHAQPDACPDCGPMLTLLDASGRAIVLEGTDPPGGAGARVVADGPMAAGAAGAMAAQPSAGKAPRPAGAAADRPGDDAVALIPLVIGALREGKIVAIKGIGGFHLAVDATREGSVERLRERKRREEKPFAIMSGALDAVRTYAEVGPEEERLLTDPARPIVLLERRPGARVIATAVAPGNRRLGVMLPCTPLHALLFSGYVVRAPAALVMTSANRGEEPIVRENDEAVERLAGIADLFLVHDREIHRRADDSVVRIGRGRPVLIRRSRGYVPAAVRLRDPVDAILACGAHLKSTICITRGRNAYLSPHIGDLENDLAYGYYVETIDHLERILDIRPRVVAHDLHPDYLSTRHAMEREADRRVAVQHHHAHIASCLAENGARGPVIGVACDGTGLGDDGTIWGGEILRADLAGCERVGHLEPFPLPGGDAAAREAWRPAFSLLRAALPDRYRAVFRELFPEIPDATAALVDEAIERGLNAPMTSSLGRLFDGVSALTGVARRSTYEGQAAIALEQAIGPDRCGPRRGAVARNGAIAWDREPQEGEGSRLPGDGAPPPGDYRARLREEDGPVVIETAHLVRAVVEDVAAGAPAGEIARRFHRFVIESLFEAVRVAADRTGLRTIALSGGCFQNAVLLEGLALRLEAAGLDVLTHSLVPPNDGGIALGQAVVAGAVRASG